MKKKKNKFLQILRRLFYKKSDKRMFYLREELIRKDKIITEMKERNKILLDTIVRQSNEMLDLKEKIKYFNEKLK